MKLTKVLALLLAVLMTLTLCTACDDDNLTLYVEQILHILSFFCMVIFE